MAHPSDDTVPVPTRLLDLAAWEALGEFERVRLELVEGVLHVAAAPVRRHQRIVRTLGDQLRDGLPTTWAVEGDVDMIVAHDDGRGGPWPTIRRPDVAVFPESRALDREILDATEVLLVAEVLSPGSRRVDRIAKLADYAEAGIEHYLLVDTDPVSLTHVRLDAGTYRPVIEVVAPAVVTLELDGTDVPIDLGALTRR